MSTLWLKRLCWLVALLLVTAGALLALPALGGLYARTQQVQVQNGALNLLSELHAEPGQLEWQTDDADTPRTLEPYARDAVTSGYRRGFEELGYALYSGDSSGLGSYFQEGPLADARLATGAGLAAGSGLATGARLPTQSVLKTEFAAWDHRLTLHFYAPDGATVAFTDRYWYAEAGASGTKLVGPRCARRTVEVVMALDDGNWRLHQWRVVSEETLAGTLLAAPGLARQLSTVRGVNYEARSAPFAALWTKFDPAEVDRDFARVHRLGLNTVRLFVPYPLPPDAPATLETLMRLADRHGLKVIPTLLDGYARYRLADLPSIFQALELLRPALSRSAVLTIDLKNEADLDAGKVGWPRLRFFLKVLAEQTRARTGKPVTVGTASPDPELAGALDLLTLHSYAAPAQLEGQLQAATRLGRPLLLEEFGYHTQADKLPDPHTEADQARYLARVRGATRRQDVGWLAWTLYDLPAGNGVGTGVGAVPGGREVERHLGLFRADGAAKPGVLALQTGVAPAERPFERIQRYRFLTLPLVLAASLLLSWIWWRSRPRRSSTRPQTDRSET